MSKARLIPVALFTFIVLILGIAVANTRIQIEKTTSLIDITYHDATDILTFKEYQRQESGMVSDDIAINSFYNPDSTKWILFTGKINDPDQNSSRRFRIMDAMTVKSDQTLHINFMMDDYCFINPTQTRVPRLPEKAEPILAAIHIVPNAYEGSEENRHCWLGPVQAAWMIDPVTGQFNPMPRPDLVSCFYGGCHEDRN